MYKEIIKCRDPDVLKEMKAQTNTIIDNDLGAFDFLAALRAFLISFSLFKKNMLDSPNELKQTLFERIESIRERIVQQYYQ